MVNTNKNIEKIKLNILNVLKKYDIVRAGIFGSYARGNIKKGSDIDILIEPSNKMGFAFMKIQFELEKKLNKKVDLLTYKSINPLLRKRILNEEVRLI
ncbi:MAG: nucleotidyltransferase family protein [Nanoarchaeota archaeon]